MSVITRLVVLVVIVAVAAAPARAGTGCLGDTNGDLIVDIDDVVNVILDFGTDGSANGGDVDGSGLVDIDDVVTAVLAFGPCPPINDACAAAIPVAEGDHPYATAGATSAGPDHPSCDGDGDGVTATEDVWFRYTASFDGFGLFTNCGAADHDSEIVVYRAAPCDELGAPLNLLACNDSFPCGSGQSSVDTMVCAGNDYLVRVGSGAPGTTGAGVLSIAVAVPGGTYIGCDGGDVIAPGETRATETCYSCADLPFPTCGDAGGGSNTVWFETVGDGTTYTAVACGTGFTPRIRVYRGTCAALQCVADAPADACAGGVTWSTVPGVEYQVVVYGQGPVTCGPIEVTVVSGAP